MSTTDTFITWKIPPFHHFCLAGFAFHSTALIKLSYDCCVNQKGGDTKRYLNITFGHTRAGAFFLFPCLLRVKPKTSFKQL